jgi:hypothetical protein
MSNQPLKPTAGMFGGFHHSDRRGGLAFSSAETKSKKLFQPNGAALR